MLDVFNSFRNQEGYIELEKIPSLSLLDKNTFGSRQKLWFQTNEMEILFKQNMKINEDITEILNEFISHNLDIECASYDTAIYQGQKGVITQQFLQSKDEFLPAICLLCSDHNHKISNDIYTFLLALEYNQFDSKQIETIIAKLFQNQIQDIFTAQFDRNWGNLAFIQRQNQILLAPRHDSAGSFLSIFDPNKITHFLDMGKEKEQLFLRYKGFRTKFRISPFEKKYNAMQELVHASYGETYSQLPKSMQIGIKQALPLIEKLSLFSFKEVFQMLNDYNLEIPKRQQAFYQYILDYNIEMYEKEKQKVYNKF